MPFNQLKDPLLQKMGPLPIPEAVKLLEEVGEEDKRHNLAKWLACFWSGGVVDVATACECISRSALDEISKEILIRGVNG